MRRLTATLCLTLALLLGSGNANASDNCEDTSDPRYDPSECEEQTPSPTVTAEKQSEAVHTTNSALPACPSDQDQYRNNCFGTYTYPKGGKYVGEYRDGSPNGQGTYTFGPQLKWAGDIYVGEFWDGKRWGQGTLTFADGGKYVGEWMNGKPNGQGTETYDAPHKLAGDKFVGEFTGGKKNGQGTSTWANGDKFVGEYRDSKRNGQGTYTSADGRNYVGEWKDDLPHGYGTRYAANGTVEKQGYWENGKLVRSTKKDEIEEPKSATKSTTTSNSATRASLLEKIENKCTELGFTKGTEKHGDCVMKLYK